MAIRASSTEKLASECLMASMDNATISAQTFKASLIHALAVTDHFF
jgi:hypothetical protein